MADGERGASTDHARSVTCASRCSSNANKMAESHVTFPRKLLKKFILLYKECNCLWDKNSVTYKHKQKRHEAIKKLTELVQEYDANATRVHVLRKIESLRACVRREYNKVRDSRLVAQNDGEVYTPALWYYNLLSFVWEDGTFKEVHRSPEPTSEGEEIDIPEEDVSCESMNTYTDYSTPLVEVNETPKKHNFEDDKSKRHCTEVEDEYDAIGINVAAKLRGLPPSMRILAEKLINDVLFQAQMNGLNSSTIITNPGDPFKPETL